jgi:hypothetical protein
MTNYQHTPTPKALRSARIALYVQSVLSIAAGVFVITLLSTLDAGDGAGFLAAAAVIGILIGAFLLACAILLPRRLRWVRGAVLAVETINVAIGMLGLIAVISTGESAQPTGILSIVISFLVIRPLMRADVREWFANEEEKRMA